MQPSNVTSTLFENLSFRSERQKVISGNIANINTPNYKTKELVFEQELQQANDDLKLKTTHNKHIAFDLENPKTTGPQLVEVQNLLEQNDGNNVSLDKQISEMSKNTVIFNALQASIKKDSQWLKAIIDSSAKN
ncbi:MAG: flagellar basal body rod protein FlgB [Deltaproteobacteria bacterium HGW-Deltaproteobacteria-24]|nr:MAG: flagellar basal body rod protein FlgB [Deltaproteobacteria bacterium HGW-Deltaproteobacteria-24]